MLQKAANGKVESHFELCFCIHVYSANCDLFAAGAIWELHDLAGKARGHKANCLLLDSFLQDVMRTLDNQGRALAQVDSLQLAHLLELTESAIELVDGCNKPGRSCMISWYTTSVAS